MSDLLKKYLDNICLMMETMSRVYKGIHSDFAFAGHKGFEAFLWWESMERLEIMEKLQRAMFLTGYRVSFPSLQAVPSEYQSPIIALKEMLDSESKVMIALYETIEIAGNEKSYILKHCLVKLASMCQKEYNEVHGVLKKLEFINPDIAALLMFDNYLEEHYSKEKYYAKELEKCETEYK